MLSEKDNLLKMLDGECPDWVPIIMYHPGVTPQRKPAMMTVMPPLLNACMVGGRDVWGIEMEATASSDGGYIQKPGSAILEDVTQWRDRVRAPALADFDWERLVKRQLDELGVDRRETALALMLHRGYFIDLVGILGFAETLIALAEEPEEVRALLDYMSDFYTGVTRAVLPYYRPDFLSLGEDCVSSTMPLISQPTFHDILLPASAKQAAAADLPVIFHCCGKGDIYIEDWLSIGTRIWECATPYNDLQAVKRRYGNRLIINGGWDATISLPRMNPTDEELIESVRRAIDMYAPGGGYCYTGGFLGATADEETVRRNKLLYRTAEEYGGSFYA